MISCNLDCPVDSIYNEFDNACIPLNLILRDDINIDEICTGIFFSPRPHPEDKTLYIGCMRGLPMILRCYENEIFEETQLECIFRIPETTTELIITTTTEIPTEPITTTRTEVLTEPTTTKPKNPCEGITTGQIPHPTNCTLCQMCILQQIVEIECKCEPGLIFWISECVIGDSDTCEPWN
ncbi:hypothetical protein ACKWTF_012207 [Chironomus riparius]